MDDADRAGPTIENVIKDGLAKAKRAMNHGLIPIIQLDEDGSRVGLCHHCASPISPGQLFCPIDPKFPDDSCRDDWQREQDARSRNGS